MDDIKYAYKEKFGHSVSKRGLEDGVKFVVIRGVLPVISTLKQTLDEIKSLYETKFGPSFAEEVAEKDGFEFIVTRGPTSIDFPF